MKKNIFCDLDMTICDTIYPVREMVKQDHGVDFNIGEFKSYGFLEEQLGPKSREYWAKPDLYDRTPLYPFAVWFIEKLKTLGNLYIITYSACDNIKGKKDEFVKKKLGIDTVFHEREKYKRLGEDDILIDDYLVNIQGHCHYNNGHSILFNHNGENPWAVYHPKTVLTERHHYAESYIDVIDKVKALI